MLVSLVRRNIWKDGKDTPLLQHKRNRWAADDDDDINYHEIQYYTSFKYPISDFKWLPHFCMV